LHTKLASFSYSLYLVHFPMMLLIIAIVQEYVGIEFLQQPTTESYLYFTLIVIFLCLYGYLFALITEKHTFKLVTLLRRIIVSGKY